MASAEPANDASQNELLNLYDDMNEHFEGNDFDKTTEASELYDAVLTGLVNQDKSVVPNQMQKRPTINTPLEVGRKPSIDRGEQSTSKHSLYVGNFSWWISDKDLMHMAQSLGVMDIIEIKFAENKINGQSRGYAEVVVASEASLRTLLDKVPQCKISGENLSCRSATYQNLAFFETLANKRMPMRVKDPKELDSPPPNSANLNPPPMPLIYPLIPPPNYPPSNPFLTHPPPQPLHIPLNIPQPMVPPFPPPPFHYGQPPPSLHINPAFLPPHNSSAYQPKKNSTQKSDDDFEELMNRNRTITSTAISKAVSDATTGDMHMATETLLTAIAVIKQSRVYEDDCCQALVTSLKDCLVSIRGNYDSRKDRERDRVKERDRNRDREREDSHGKSRRYKERSWSGGRDRNHERDTRERDTRERNTRERDTRERDTRERNTRERDTRDRNTHERDTRERDPRDPRERDPRDPRERDPRERDPRDPRERDPRERDTRERDRHRDPRDRYR